MLPKKYKMNAIWESCTSDASEIFSVLRKYCDSDLRFSFVPAISDFRLCQWSQIFVCARDLRFSFVPVLSDFYLCQLSPIFTCASDLRFAIWYILWRTLAYIAHYSKDETKNSKNFVHANAYPRPNYSNKKVINIKKLKTMHFMVCSLLNTRLSNIIIMSYTVWWSINTSSITLHPLIQILSNWKMWYIISVHSFL